jgi:phosphatidylinositol phospholipase C beta
VVGYFGLFIRFSVILHRDVNIPVPPCPTLSSNEDSTNERLMNVCREHAATYRELLEKYHEQIFSIAESLLQKSQENQMLQLRKLQEKETSEVMRQLQHSRKSEVKKLTLVHKDKDELERMKREVASTVVEKGVAERVRLTASYEKRKEELQKQHDAVRGTLVEQKEKVSALLQAAAVHSLQCSFPPFTDQVNAGERREQPGMCLVRVDNEFLQRPHPANVVGQQHEPVIKR